MKRIFARFLIISLLLSLFSFSAMAAKIREIEISPKASSLKIRVPSDVSVTLYTGLAGSGSTVSASSSSTSEGVKTLSYNNLSTGTYSFYARGTGYYHYYKSIYYTSGTTVTYDGNPGKKTGVGYESERSVEYSDAALQSAFLNAPDAWPGYEGIFDTPFFTVEGKGKNEFTTNEEMMTYLRCLDGADDSMYLYSLGLSPSYQAEMPIVIFTTTDLSGKTMEEAAALLRANGKPTFLHQAQIHGNEPAAGEGALALCGGLDRGDIKNNEGENILESVNVLVVPRINPDGSKDFQRINTKDGLNMNRDYLAVNSLEVEYLLRA